MPLFGIKCHSNAHFLFRCAWFGEHLISRTDVRTAEKTAIPSYINMKLVKHLIISRANGGNAVLLSP